MYSIYFGIYKVIYQNIQLIVFYQIRDVQWWFGVWSKHGQFQ